MPATEEEIRSLCTDAVFERGRNYHSEERIEELTRIGDAVNAVVRGSRAYDTSIDLSADGFDPRCTCPYGGPGECKHVVAVLLAVAEDPPSDEGEWIDAVLDAVPSDDLRVFVREELARDLAMRERFYAAFDDAHAKSAADYRERVERLFDEHAEDYLVVGAIDFSPVTDIAERYHERGRYAEAATVYRGFIDGLDENMERVDAAYDHYTTTFRDALDAYVDCVSRLEPGSEAREANEEFLSNRVFAGTDYLREHYERAYDELRTD